jgi:predicted phosphodiesterase
MRKPDPRFEQILDNLDKYEFDLKRAKEIDDFRTISAKAVEQRPILMCDFTPKTGSIKLVPLYDIHYGLKNCNEELLDCYLKYIESTEDCYTIIGGDSCETATRESVGLATFEEVLHTGNQRRSLTDKLRPLAQKGKILGAVTGNHEMRAQRFNEDNPMVELCYDLGIPYCGHSTFIDMYVNDINYQVFMCHGSGGSATPGGRANAAAKAGATAIADLYLSGHTHSRGLVERKLRIVENGKEITMRQAFVAGGSLVNYFDSYAEEKMLSPSVVGLVLITLYGNEKYVGTYF